MINKEKKNKIADILLDFYDEYHSNEINRPMIPSIYVGKILNSLQEESANGNFEAEVKNLWKEINTGHNYSIVDSYNQFYGLCMEIADWQKEQLMAKAVNGFVIKDIEEGNGDFLLSADYLPKDMGLKDRQKVKVIVIKED